jgi:hypothetical protein
MSSALRPTPNLEDEVPTFMSPCDTVTQLYPQVQGYLFVAFYFSQGYGGGILTCLHMGSVSLYNDILACLNVISMLLSFILLLHN